ncbi:MAG: shikimate dehydrogenase [Candidatus Firestonebacteria bacterium]|nr:shikimate dehydrogenase [Candidatus Firestonebacteria bacterium]
MQASVSITGILGKNVKQSLLFNIYNQIFNELDLPCQYIPFEVMPNHLEEAVIGIRQMKMMGVNVTYPYNEKITEYIDEITEDSKIIGNINTIKNYNDILIGYNTYGKSVVEALEKKCKIYPDSKSLLILGAGCTAKSIAVTFAKAGAKQIFIANRTMLHSEEIKNVINSNIPECNVNIFTLNAPKIKEIIKDVDIIINTTPLGMKKNDPSLLNAELISKNKVILDTVCNPLKTLLIREACIKGCLNVEGINIFAMQCAIDLEIWTDKIYPIDIIEKTIMKQLRG